MSRNGFAEAARARKVAALVEPRSQYGAMARTLRGLDQLAWFAHALAAGQHKPSPVTQAEVIAVYERRAANWAARADFVRVESNRSERRAP